MDEEIKARVVAGPRDAVTARRRPLSLLPPRLSLSVSRISHLIVYPPRSPVFAISCARAKFSAAFPRSRPGLGPTLPTLPTLRLAPCADPADPAPCTVDRAPLFAARSARP